MTRQKYVEMHCGCILVVEALSLHAPNPHPAQDKYHTVINMTDRQACLSPFILLFQGLHGFLQSIVQRLRAFSLQHNKR